MTLLKVDALTVEFGDKTDRFRAVDRISYTVNRGEVVDRKSTRLNSSH